MLKRKYEISWNIWKLIAMAFLNAVAVMSFSFTLVVQCLVASSAASCIQAVETSLFSIFKKIMQNATRFYSNNYIFRSYLQGVF